MEDPSSLLSLFAILCFGIFVQAAAGFAAGLIIVPSLLWFGWNIAEAQAALLVATIPQNLGGVWKFRESISLPQVSFWGGTRVVFYPVGCFLLIGLQSYPMDRVRQVVGLIVLMATIAIILFNPRPKESLHPAWAWIAFPVSGFLQGLVGMGGPAMVFWVQAHDWTTRQTRGFMFSMYLISILPALLVLYWFFGDSIFKPMLCAAVAFPVLLLATWIGLKFGDLLGKKRLRRVTYFLLLLIGLAGILSPYISKAVGTAGSESISQIEIVPELPAVNR